MICQLDNSVASVRKSIENVAGCLSRVSEIKELLNEKKVAPKKFMERVLREDLEEKSRQLKLKNEVKYELERS